MSRFRLAGLVTLPVCSLALVSVMWFSGKLGWHLFIFALPFYISWLVFCLVPFLVFLLPIAISVRAQQNASLTEIIIGGGCLGALPLACLLPLVVVLFAPRQHTDWGAVAWQTLVTALIGLACGAGAALFFGAVSGLTIRSSRPLRIGTV